MTFYRKYRSQKIDELDLENVRKTLKQLSSNVASMPHAFLFTGPRGTGKTSSARILAKVVNCENPIKVKEENFEYYEPCDKCDQCVSINKGSNIDVIEIDAASHRGIDDIRELKESINLSPSLSNKKFYIIDEAHMLTTEAANAFLKTLEEPPAHVIFVLATTDPEKLPATVRSRLSHLNFSRASKEEIGRVLDRIVESEKLDLKSSDIDQIVSLSEGSFRDAVKYLEDISMGIDISTNLTANNAELLNYLSERDSKKLLMQTKKFWKEGKSEKAILADLIKELRNILHGYYGLSDADDYGLSEKDVVKLIDLLLEAESKLKTSSEPFICTEIAFVNWCFENTSNIQVEKKVKKKTKKLAVDSPIEFDELAWSRILSQMREKNASIEALLRSAKPLGLDGNNFKLEVYYRFHKERLDNNSLRKTFEDVCSDVLGLKTIKIICTLGQREEPLVPKIDPPLQMAREKNIVQAAKEVFG